MTLRDALIIGLITLSLTVLAGCQPAASSGGGGGGDGDTEAQADDGTTGGDDTGGQAEDDAGGTGEGDGETANENSTGDDGAAAGDDGGTDDGADAGEEDGEETEVDNDNTGDEEEPVLTDQQEEAVEDTVAVIQDLASVFAVLIYAATGAADAGPIGGSDCPAFSLDDGEIILDYGDGCSPSLYPESTFSGAVSGSVDRGAGTVSVTFEDFMIDGEAVDGTVTFGYSRADGMSTLEAQVDLVFSDEGGDIGVTGEATVVIDETTGEITITYADLVISDSDQSDTVVLEDVHSDFASNGNFLPDAGTASIHWDEPPPPVTMTITFTDQTPVDGSVLITVNGVTVPYTVGDVIEAIEELE